MLQACDHMTQMTLVMCSTRKYRKSPRGSNDWKFTLRCQLWNSKSYLRVYGLQNLCIIASNISIIMNGRLEYSELVFWHTIPTIVWRNEKTNIKFLRTITSIQANIRLGHLANTWSNRYHILFICRSFSDRSKINWLFQHTNKIFWHEYKVRCEATAK
jgi:hypothetical protein